MPGRKPDIPLLLWLGVCALMIVMGMFGVAGGFTQFLHLFVYQAHAIEMVFVASFSVLLSTMSFAENKRLIGMAKICFTLNPKDSDFKTLINQLTELASKARREGVLALEGMLSDLQDEFMKKSLELAIDGTPPETIKEILYIELAALEERHEVNHMFFIKWAELAPCFGLLATITGLVGMLTNLSDPAAVGPSMALSMVATLYGIALANVICIPFNMKLKKQTLNELRGKEMIIETVISIQNGENPQLVLRKLLSFLSPKDRMAITAATAAS